MKQPLNFKDFGPCDMETWRNMVKKELGDKPYENIVWKDENGLSLEPYLNIDGNLQAISITNQKNWQIAQTFPSENDAEWNQSILTALMGGVQHLTLDFRNQNFCNIGSVLKDVLLDVISIRFINHPDPLKLLQNFNQFAVSLDLDLAKVSGSIRVDQSDEMLLNQIAFYCKTSLPSFHAVEIDGIGFHNRGANAVLEISASLSVAHNRLFQLMKNGMSLREVNSQLQFNVGVSSSYFVEIAKIRVLRQLWNFILTNYDSSIDQEKDRCLIYAETSLRTQVEADIHNNLLRTATQTMSTIIGGADVVNTLPYNAFKEKSDVTSMRLARNIQHLLIEESYLGAASNAVSGTYYISEIVEQLADKVWSLFRDIENKGVDAPEYISSLLKQQNDVRNLEIEQGKRIVVGLNKYQQTASEIVT